MSRRSFARKTRQVAVDGDAAVGDEDGAVQIRGVIGGEGQGYLRDLFRRAVAA